MYTNSDTVNEARANERNADFLQPTTSVSCGYSSEGSKGGTHLASQPPWTRFPYEFSERIWRNSDIVP